MPVAINGALQTRRRPLLPKKEGEYEAALGVRSLPRRPRQRPHRTVPIQHMVKYRNHHDGADPSAHLALEIGERQMEVIKPTEDDLRRGRILKDATVESSRKLATRKLNNLGTFVGHCAVINSEENTRRMEEDLRLASTIEAIRTDAKTRAKAKAVQAQQSYRALAPKASRKLREKEGDTSKLEKKEMAALLLVVYSIFLDPKKQTNKKSVFVEKLNKAIEADPAKLAQYHNLVDSGNGQDSSANSGGDDNNIEPAATEDDDSGDDIEIDGDAYKEKRIAAFRRGALRLGTVVDFGVDEEDVDGWTIEFDDEDVVDYKDGTKGKEEDFSYAELKHSLQLYDEEGFMLESAE